MKSGIADCNQSSGDVVLEKHENRVKGIISG